MNISVIVEGATGSKRIYRNWIPLINPNITYVETVSGITRNNFAITAAYGYPQYFDMIDRAIDDVNHFHNIDRLVIAVDSEDSSCADKYIEVADFVASKTCRAQIFIIIQHFCIETWALANKRVCKLNPCNNVLIKYKRFFDVRQRDPELLPPYPKEELNRAQFAERYLRAILNEWNRNLGYSKHNPKALLSRSYFDQVKNRFDTTAHIRSFATFLDAFI